MDTLDTAELKRAQHGFRHSAHKAHTEYSTRITTSKILTTYLLSPLFPLVSSRRERKGLAAMRSLTAATMQTAFP